MPKRTHGMTNTSSYRRWANMKRRCYNPNHPNYPDYGGRGIKVHERWHSFENFYLDMGDPPSLRHWIDRIDNNGDYSPGNCRWATPREQARNRRNNHLLSYEGETHTIAEWADKSGLNPKTFSNRLNRGWPVDMHLFD